MANTILEVSAMMKVREGKLQGFKKQAAEIIRLAKEKDTKTLRYDWFLSKDETECEVREAYESSEGLIEHRMHIVDSSVNMPKGMRSRSMESRRLNCGKC